jgi:signal peptidase I
LEATLSIEPVDVPAPAAPGEKENSLGSFLLETLQTIVLAVVLYFLIDSVIARVRVENLSMEPTLMPGEFLLVNKMAYRIGEFERGDIIVFHYPQNPSEDYIKRLIGLPGDVVKVENSVVYVNDQPLDEPYISSAVTYSGEWVVPENAFFVLGDNRNQSSDSHSWGFVPVENVVGKALVVYWPFAQAKVLRHAELVQAAQ